RPWPITGPSSRASKPAIPKPANGSRANTSRVCDKHCKPAYNPRSRHPAQTITSSAGATHAMTLVTLGIVGGAFLAGFIQGLSGFACAPIATTIWVWCVEPKILVPLVLSSSLVGQIATTHAVGRHISMARVSPFLIGALVGVPIGVAIFHRIDANAFRLGTGIILIVYSTFM